jgi:hypothetical protein
MWLKNDYSGDKYDFVVVKVPGCSKCENFESWDSVLRKEELFRSFIFDNKDKDPVGHKILSEIGRTEVPYIIYRYISLDTNEIKYSAMDINFSEPEVVDNILDALYIGDKYYFGYNEYNEITDKEYPPSEEDKRFLQCINLMHGKPDLSERDEFKNSIIT